MKQITGYNSEKLSTENYFACIDAFYITNWINFVSRYHAHSHIEIMYVEKGSCTIDIGESLYHFKRGEFIIINANTYHKLLVENEPCQIINLEFHFQSITDDLLSFSSIIRQSRYMMGLLSCQNNYYCLRDSGDLKYLLRSIISTQSIESDRFLLTQLQISELLIRISHSIDEFSLDNRQDTFTYVKKVMNFLEINYDRDLTVDDIAAHVNLHPSYLQKIFKKNLNCTMFAYLKKLRIEKSKMLLSTTDLLITEIPSYIGMNSVQYYVNLFHKINHCTPLQYRKEHSSAFRTDEYDDSFTAKEKK